MATSQIATNMSAVYTHNVFAKNNAGMSAALNRVSTGLKINSAKDGASQYAISEKMRERINSNQQVSQNIQNDSALSRTASSGLDNTLSILKTLKARALDAANDTNSADDRKIIQKEVAELVNQITENSTSVKYNGKTLLDGSYSEGVASNSKTIAFNGLATETLASTMKDLGILNADPASNSATVKLSVSWTKGGLYKELEVATYTSATTLSNILSAIDSDSDFSTQVTTANKQISSEKDENGDPIRATAAGVAVVAGSDGSAGDFSGLTFTISPNNPGNGTAKTYTFSEIHKGTDQKTGGSLTFQIGEMQNMTATLTLSDMSASGLSLQNLSVMTKAAATGALDSIEKAIDTVLQKQADIGALEQRLGYVADNIDTINENLQAADSAVRDADLSQEISNFMKYSVLSQSAQYMLAQSHQNAFQVLNLLQ